MPQGVQLDFSKAQPVNQGAVTLDFSKAQRVDDFSSHPPPAAGPHVDMQPIAGTESLNIPRSMSLGPGQPEKDPNLGTAGIAGLGIGAAAAVGPAAIPPVARAGAKFIRNHPIIATAALEGAKEIPGIGKYVSKIPSWLPMLAGGKGGAASAEAEAAIPEAEAAGQAIARPISAPRAPLPDSFHAGPGPVIQRGPIPGSKADLAESRIIEDDVRHRALGEEQTFASQQKRDWFGRNQPGSSKSELTGQIAKPVKYTKTPGVRAPEGIKPGTTVPEPNEDLTPVLEKSLAAARKKKR